MEMSDPGPAVDAVLETALYHEPSERAAMERFYGDLLGLAAVARWPDGLALRLGDGVLLLFDRAGLAERQGPIADHGTTGPGHVCLTAVGERYEAARRRLAEAGVEVVHDHEWDGGRHSFYFRDPAGNLVEIADSDLWPASPAE
jgi:catechol 2,3-dioxygenase-like lactoylglutathione lyase family enzyme